MAGRDDKPGLPHLFHRPFRRRAAGKLSRARIEPRGLPSRLSEGRASAELRIAAHVELSVLQSAWGFFVCLIGRRRDRFGVAEKSYGQTVVCSRRRRVGSDHAGAVLRRPHSAFERGAERPPAERKTPAFTVNRALKGDRLPLSPAAGQTLSRSAFRARWQSRTPDEMPIGCEPAFSPVTNPQLAYYYGRCTT